MTRTNSALLLLAVFAAACATTAPPPKVAVAPVAPPQSSLLSPQSSEYRKALEEAYAAIVAREHAPVAAPRVDVEAAVSIPIPEHKTIRGALAYFTTDLKPSIQESLLRSAKYKKLIDGALDEAKLPKGLAYLPVIESAYLPTLTSRAGAHGIWQFMPETAREYGLRVDWWVDERADPERSTRAAVASLRDLYRQFNDWPLTLAAYNAGPGRIRRALETNGATTFWELCDAGAMPKRPRGYVPTFFATLMIASDPATYGFRLGESKDLDGKRIAVEGPLSLRHVADVAQVDEAVLRELNPALRQGVVPPGRGEVRVPVKSAEAVAARAATMENDDADLGICTFTLRDGGSITGPPSASPPRHFSPRQSRTRRSPLPYRLSAQLRAHQRARVLRCRSGERAQRRDRRPRQGAAQRPRRGRALRRRRHRPAEGWRQRRRLHRRPEPRRTLLHPRQGTGRVVPQAGLHARRAGVAIRRTAGPGAAALHGAGGDGNPRTRPVGL